MSEGTDAVAAGVMELDYDVELGETRRIAVDPWTGRLQGASDPATPLPALHGGDPDRTSRVKVDPWTGHVLVEPFQDPASILHVPDRGPPLDERRLDLRMAALVVGASLCAGAIIGSVIAAIALV